METTTVTHGFATLGPSRSGAGLRRLRFHPAADVVVDDDRSATPRPWPLPAASNYCTRSLFRGTVAKYRVRRADLVRMYQRLTIKPQRFAMFAYR